MLNYNSILEQFALGAEVLEVSPLGNGLINDTFKVHCAGPRDFVLQRINHAIFQDVDLLQGNIAAVTGHIRAKLAGDPDLERKVLRFVPLRDSEKTYYYDGESYWRVSVFIPDAYTFEAVTPEYAGYAGRAFGQFEAMLSDLPVELGETIPGFHNIELRLSQFDDAVSADKAGRVSACREIIDEINALRDDMCLGERLHREGLLPKRVCHCDTKVNNMLFDADGRVLCVIDLDTVMPSFIFSDVGDFLRTAGSTVAEDDPDISKVAFRRDIFEPFISGYLSATAGFLTPCERENLPYGIALFPYMQAVRFFADYLNGDTYYKIRYPDHNLVRTRNQLALLHSVLSNQDYISSKI